METKAESLTSARHVIARCQKLARFSEVPDSTRRTFLSAPMRDCHGEIADWLKPLGVSPTVDAAGNLRGVYAGTKPNGPRLLIGSHLDTVPYAGAYDGVLGVVLAVELLKALQGRPLPFAIELVAFSDEEGVRFGAPFIGSRALVGRLTEDLLERNDARGISVRRAIEDFGLDPREIPQAAIAEGAIGYLEFHIEQGPVLEKLQRPLAVVEAIVGQSRLELTFLGRAGHAGTTPMDLRYDAVAGAAEWISAVEQHARGVPGLVATVGQVNVKPGANNVIAGEARLTLDVRHGANGVRARAVADLLHQASEIATRRGLAVRHQVFLDQDAVAMDPVFIHQIEEAVRKTGCPPHRMVSGAGHDAMILAEKVPSAMIFLRTPGGISHDPAESVAVEDVALALECGSHLLDQLAFPSSGVTRT